MKFFQKKYISDFNKENYDCISLRAPKGYKEKFKELAKKQGLSMAGFIVKIVDESDAQ